MCDHLTDVERKYLSESNRRLVKRILPAKRFNGTIVVDCTCCLIRSLKFTDVAATIANGNRIEKIHSFTIINIKHIHINYRLFSGDMLSLS